MATVMFSTLGRAVGGPFGAAVGAVAGGTVDSTISQRAGGNTASLVQRSAYGQPIPRLYGRVRTAGLMIWALPMQQGGQKGSGRKAYATSFAVALSSRTIIDVGRIWADGREFRNTAGDFQIDTRMRLYRGDRAQPVDPAIAGAEGATGAPAYQGLSYVVFEDFSLAPFGNRIPNLNFEVIADDGDDLAGWMRDLAAETGMPVSETMGEPRFNGFIASGGRWIDDIATFSELAGLSLVFTSGSAHLSHSPRTVVIPKADILGADGNSADGSSRRLATGERLRSLSVGYQDPDRDYQQGRQQVTRRREGGAADIQEALVASASSARKIAETLLAARDAAVSRCEILLPWRWLDLNVGDWLAVEELPARWRITDVAIENALVRIGAEALPVTSSAVPESDGGRGLPAPVVPVPPTLLSVFEAPLPLKPGSDGPGIWVAPTGGDGWKGAEIRWETAGEEAVLGQVGEPSPAGTLLADCKAGPVTCWDETASLLIDTTGMQSGFESRPALDVLGGANLLLVGDEFMQYRSSVPIDTTKFRLSGLLRGRMGTEYAVREHAAGTHVQQILATNLLFIPVSADAIGAEKIISAYRLIDGFPDAERAWTVRGSGISGLGPVHLSAEKRVNGDILFSWISRSRANFDWSSPPDPAEQNFVVNVASVVGGEMVNAQFSATGRNFLLTANDQIVKFGQQISDIDFHVVCVGDGPFELRSSFPVTMNF